MNIETFKFNLKNRIVPQAQSILISNGYHHPAIFTYDNKGREVLGDLTELFKERNKDLIFRVLEDYVKETNTLALVLINEAWMKTIKKEDEHKHKELLEGRASIKDMGNKKEVITFMWMFKSSDVKSGSITYPFKKENGNVIIDYKNHKDLEGVDARSRFSTLLRK